MNFAIVSQNVATLLVHGIILLCMDVILLFQKKKNTEYGFLGTLYVITAGTFFLKQ